VELSWIAKKTRLPFQEAKFLADRLERDPYGIKNKHDVAILARLPETHERWRHYTPSQRKIIVEMTKSQSHIHVPLRLRDEAEAVQRAIHAAHLAAAQYRRDIGLPPPRSNFRACSRCGLFGHRRESCRIQDIPSVVVVDEVEFST
jgi:hypothetical protein